MKRFLILLAAIAILAGEPAVAAPSPPPDMPPLNLGLIPGLLYQMVHCGGTCSSPPVR